MAKRFHITVDVADQWILDGFDLTDQEITDIFLRVLGYAYPDEVKGRLIKVTNCKLGSDNRDP